VLEMVGAVASKRRLVGQIRAHGAERRQGPCLEVAQPASLARSETQARRDRDSDATPGGRGMLV